VAPHRAPPLPRMLRVATAPVQLMEEPSMPGAKGMTHRNWEKKSAKTLLVSGLEHLDYFLFHIWDVILPN
jgi:hypothetical protein